MLNRVAQRDQAAEANSTEEDWTFTEHLDQAMQRKDMVVLVDEKRRLVGGALAEEIECRNAKSPCDERVTISGPQFGILGQSVDQHVGRCRRRTVELIPDPVGAVGEERHRGDPADNLVPNSRAGSANSLAVDQRSRRVPS